MAVEYANMAVSMIAGVQEKCSQLCHDMIIDSGCTRHMTNYQELAEPEKIMIAIGSIIDADGKGDLKKGEVFMLKDTLHIPDINKTLISVTRMNDDGYCVSFETSSEAIMMDRSSRRRWLIGQREDNVYYL
jgi:hypothetical protein